MDEIKDVTTHTAGLAVPAPRRHGVLKAGTTLAAVPRAAAHALRVVPGALPPPVLVKRRVVEHQIRQPRAQHLLHLLFEEPAADLPARDRRLPELGIQRLLVRVAEPLHWLAEAAQHIEHPLGHQRDFALVVVEPLVGLLGVWVGAARHHALALVEAQHYLLVGLLRRSVALLGVTLHIAVTQPPHSVLPQDQRLDVTQLGHQRGRNPVQQLPASGLTRSPRHGALFAVGVVPAPRCLFVASVGRRPIDVERDEPTAELTGDHPEPVIARVGLVGLLAQVAAEWLRAPLLDKGRFAGYWNKGPPIGKDVLSQQLDGPTFELVRTICN